MKRTKKTVCTKNKCGKPHLISGVTEPRTASRRKCEQSFRFDGVRLENGKYPALSLTWRSVVSEEHTNALKHAELFKSKSFLGGHREQSNSYFSGKGKLWIRKCSIESIKPGAKGSEGSAYVAIFALRSSKATSFITWFILGSITRDD